MPELLRLAQTHDVAAIAALLADDVLGSNRETPDDVTPYLRAFELLTADSNQYVLVAELDGNVVGTLQLSIVPGLARMGAIRAIVEAVRVSNSDRGSGIGERMFEWAVAEARRRGATLMQLTSDVSRTDAHRFYVRLGFEPSHVGFKLRL
jgi:GNAT superfamily N-acetyltransferase